MTKIRIVLLILPFLLIKQVYAQKTRLSPKDSVRILFPARNTIALHYSGNRFGITYDRVFYNRRSFFLLAGLYGSMGYSRDFRYYGVAPYAGAGVGQGNHNLILTCGPAFGYSKRYSQYPPVEQWEVTRGFDLAASAGYRYQRPAGGIFIEVKYNVTFINRITHRPSFSVGYSF